MSSKEVFAISTASGIPMAHMAWPEGSAPPLPFCVYYLNMQEGFNADDTVFASSRTWVVELYQKSSNPTIEGKLESAIAASFGPFTKSETWVDEEQCLQTAYYFKEIL